MTRPGTTTNLVDAFYAAIDATRPDIALELRRTARLEHAITRATSRGWTPAQLAHEALRDHVGIRSTTGIIQARLDDAAAGTKRAPKPAKQRPPHCGGCDPDTRHELDPRTLLPVRRCPNCHPLNQPGEATA